MKNLKKCIKLGELKVGQKCKITALNISNRPIRRHLLDMGLTVGTIVEIKKIAPMGDPIDLSLRGYELCIRKADLMQIEVEVIM
jgi:Fe2+ transport system protein FeoA